MTFFRAAGNLSNRIIHNNKQKLYNNLSYYLKQKAVSYCPKIKDSADGKKIDRTSCIISSLYQRGSLAVETSLLLPIFIFFFLHLISILQFLSCHSRIEAALHQCARNLSVYAYAYNKEDTECDNSGEQSSEWIKKTVSSIYVKMQTEQRVGKDHLEHSLIVQGAQGIDYRVKALSKEQQWIDLAAVYEVRPMFAFPGVMDIRLMNRCRMRSWTGYQVTDRQSGEREQTVYVTEHGSVYHLSAACTHLRLSVRQTAAAGVSSLRNQNGGKYYPCEICTKQNRQGNLCYITEHGNRYHHSLSCSGLKRNVREIPLSEAQNVAACSRCG